MAILSGLGVEVTKGHTGIIGDAYYKYVFQEQKFVASSAVVEVPPDDEHNSILGQWLFFGLTLGASVGLWCAIG
jgi:hypothetical protein